MADISKITLPSGNTYDIKDATARSMISGGISFNIVWTAANYAATTAPSAAALATIPEGVVVYYNSGASSATGTLAASADTKGKFYLIYSKTQAGNLDIFEEYATIENGSTFFWEKIGDTQMDISNVVTGVTLNKQTTDFVTDFPNPTTDTFVKSVSAETNKKLVTTSITPTNGTETVSKVTKAASKLVTTTVPNVTGNTSVSIPNVTGNTAVTIPNVTSAGSASTWSFTMGSGDNAETLIIGGANSVAPTLGAALTATNTTLGTPLTATNTTLGTDKTVATGAVASDGAGSDIITDVGISDKTVAKAGTAVTVATGAATTAGTGAAIVTDVTIGDSAAAITGLGTASKSAGLNNSTSITVTKGE